MHIHRITIKNFRLLEDVDLYLEKQTTVLVGRNNSGKTSFIELFRRFLSEYPPTFNLEDFSLCVHDNFWNAFKLKQDGENDNIVSEALPAIEVVLEIDYSDDLTNFGSLTTFMIDLDETSTTAVVNIRYQLRESRLDRLFGNLEFDSTQSEDVQKTTFFREIKTRIPKHFHCSLTAISPVDPTNIKNVDWPKLATLIQSGFIHAQRGLDDITDKERNTLGRILETLFNAAMLESAELDDRSTVQEIDEIVRGIQKTIDDSFSTQLTNLVPSLSLFGYPGLKDPGLKTETVLDASRLLKDHTKIQYSGINGVNLPESYNGLGARNLIFILLNLLEFFKTYKAKDTAPGFHLVFIEEPESHLHPQMQTVFIRKLKEIADVFSEKYNDNKPWPVQFIVSTHSSHVANEAPFEATRYFLTKPKENNSNAFVAIVKDLKKGFDKTEAGDTKDNRAFLHQYMTLTRCDLLFADKAILIEGTSERLLLPKMIRKIDADQPEGQKLSSQFISIMEVGGAYAHIFFELLDFLELPSLIITDLDAVDHNNNGKQCKVSEGTRTSNACIKCWFDAPQICPNDLIAKSESDKIQGSRRLSYQIPESDEDPCGRSFEAAFILANPVMCALGGTTAIEKEQGAWDMAKSVKKSEFALKYAIQEPEWKVPRYIAEGLRWLATNPSLQQENSDE